MPVEPRRRGWPAAKAETLQKCSGRARESEHRRTVVFRVELFQVGLFQVGLFQVGLFQVGLFQVELFRVELFRVLDLAPRIRFASSRLGELGSLDKTRFLEVMRFAAVLLARVAVLRWLVDNDRQRWGIQLGAFWTERPAVQTQNANLVQTRVHRTTYRQNKGSR